MWLISRISDKKIIDEYQLMNNDHNTVGDSQNQQKKKL